MIIVGHVEDNHSQTCNCFLNYYAKNYSIQLQFDDAIVKSSWLCFLWTYCMYGKANEI